MGKANPFYRFSPASSNGGFMPESNLQSSQLNIVYGEFTDDIFVGDPIGLLISFLQTTIDAYNNPLDGANLRLVYPSPWPVLSGIQTLTFYIQNDQLFAVDSTQVISITVDLNDNIVTSTTFVFLGTITNTATYANALIPVELEIRRALEVYYQNGAAIFPLAYSFDATTGIATSFLAEASDWQLDLTTGVVDRYPAIANPFGPVTYYPFAVLSAQEAYILTLFDRVINYTVLNPSATASDVETYFSSILGGLTASTATETSGILERVSIQFSESRDFLLIGRFDVTWSFQRFFNPTAATNDFFANYNISEDLPYAPLSGQLFPDGWYSLEQIQFDNGCEPDNSDTFQMPIKTGDIYQFNVIPSQANLFGLTSAKVGLFDSNLNFVQEIGTVGFPPCGLIDTVSVTFDVGGMISDIFINSADIYITFVTCDSTIEIVVPFAVMDFSGTSADFWASVLDYVALQGDYSGSYNQVFLTVTLNFIVDYSLNILSVNLSALTTYGGIGERNSRCIATQFQATVTIPYAPDGCYCFGLYNYDIVQFYDTIAEIYSFSNALILDNSECFSTIWQFGTSEDSVVEGFEYYDGWIQQVRLPINGGGEKPKIEESIYRNSDGTYQRPSNYSDNTLDLHSDYVDIETRNALFAATRHPILIFNNQNIFVSGDLDVATVQDYSKQTSFRKLAQVKFSALIQGFQPENNVCIGC
jgi:hypothetical protein